MREGARVHLVVNGEAVDLASETLAEALAELDFGDATVATALNGAFVPARARAGQPLKAGDRLEIVAPMQGG